MSEVAPYEEALQQARKAWPGFSVDPESYLAFLEARAPRIEQLQFLHTADLYLTCAAMKGVREALTIFREQVKQTVRFHARRSNHGSAPETLSDQVATRLLVIDPNRRPNLSDYLGKVPLISWLHQTVGILVVESQRGQLELRPSQSLEVEAEDMRLAEATPALNQSRSERGLFFDASFRTALATLTPRERNLLRLRFVDGLSVEEVARYHRMDTLRTEEWINDVQARIAKLTAAN